MKSTRSTWPRGTCTAGAAEAGVAAAAVVLGAAMAWLPEDSGKSIRGERSDRELWRAGRGKATERANPKFYTSDYFCMLK
jgi:hypothetical protein